MAERELEVTINATPPKYHPLTVSRIDDMSTLVFDHNIKRKHRDAKKKLRATSSIDRSDGLNRAAINARATEAAPRYRASIIFLPPICGSAVHQLPIGQTIQQFIVPLREGTGLMHSCHLVGILPQAREWLGRAVGLLLAIAGAWGRRSAAHPPTLGAGRFAPSLPLQAQRCRWSAAASASWRFFASGSCVPGTSGSDDEQQVADRRLAKPVAMFAARPKSAPALELCHEDLGRTVADLPRSPC